MAENMSLEKLIIQTSILFVSISAVIGLTLGGLIQQYRIAYINLGKMLYYSFPFIIASLWAFLALAAQTKSPTGIDWIKKLAWAFYITGFIFIMKLASLASQTEVIPEGFILTMRPVDTILWEIIAASILFVGLSANGMQKRMRKKRWIANVFTFAFILGIF